MTNMRAKWQKFAIWFIQLNQAVCLTMPYSLVVFMIRSFIRSSSAGRIVDERLVGSRAGGLTAVYSLAQCFSSYPWGWASDRIGRKPVVVAGTAATVVASLGLGLSKTYKIAVAVRFLGGFLNGNIGALKTIIAESFNRDEQAQVMGYLSLGWGAGTIIGPVAGGFLAEPCGKYKHFQHSAFCREPGGALVAYPYLLPCIFAAAMAALSCFCAALCLSESLPLAPQKTGSCSGYDIEMEPLMSVEAVAGACDSVQTGVEYPDIGLEGKCGLGQRREVVRSAGRTPTPEVMQRHLSDPDRSLQPVQDTVWIPEKEAHRVDDGSRGSARQCLPACAGPGSEEDAVNRCNGRELFTVSARGVAAVKDCHKDRVGSHEVGPLLGICAADAKPRCQPLEPAESPLIRAGPISLDEPAWYTSRNVLLLIGGYALIAFTWCLNDEVVPIFASTPLRHHGLSLNSNQLGVPLSIGGAFLMLVALLVYPRAQRRFGSYHCTRFGLLSMIPIAMLYPCSTIVLANVSNTAAYVYLTVVVCLRTLGGNFAFTGSMVMLNIVSSQVATRQVGRINGVGQSMAALVRGMAPALGGALWSQLAVTSGFQGGHFLVFAFVSAAALTGSFLYCFVDPFVKAL